MEALGRRFLCFSALSAAAASALAPAGCAPATPAIQPRVVAPAGDEQPDPPQVVSPGPATPGSADSPKHDQIVAYAERTIRRLDDLHAHVNGNRESESRVLPGDLESATVPAESDNARDAVPTPGMSAQGAALNSSVVTADPSTSAKSARKPPPLPLAPEKPAEHAAPRKPPTIVNVAVRAHAAPDADDAEKTDSDSEAPARATNSLALLTALEAQPSDHSLRDQFDRRLVHVLAGEYEQARAPFEAVAREQAAVARDFIEALIALREVHGGDLPAESSRVLEQLDKMRESLIPLSELSLPRVKICREVVGFGLYDPIAPPRFAAGGYGEFVAYCEVRHLVNRRLENDEYETQFDVTVTILTSEGRSIQENTIANVRTRWREPRHECFIAPIVSLPATLAPGDYVAKITVADRIGQKVAQQRATFQIAPGG